MNSIQNLIDYKLDYLKFQFENFAFQNCENSLSINLARSYLKNLPSSYTFLHSATSYRKLQIANFFVPNLFKHGKKFLTSVSNFTIVNQRSKMSSAQLQGAASMPSRASVKTIQPNHVQAPSVTIQQGTRSPSWAGQICHTFSYSSAPPTGKTCSNLKTIIEKTLKMFSNDAKNARCCPLTKVKHCVHEIFSKCHEQAPDKQAKMVSQINSFSRTNTAGRQHRNCKKTPR